MKYRFADCCKERRSGYGDNMTLRHALMDKNPCGQHHPLAKAMNITSLDPAMMIEKY